ncbi:MAG: ABC transporter permease, partial [Bacteroidota bacterium]
MIRPNFAFAFRSFWKEKYYTLLNIAGLSIGLCSTLLICVFIVDEQTYDSFHPEVENLHVLGAQGKIDGRQQATVMAPGAWVPSLQNDFSEVKAATQTLSPGFPASFRNPETDLITVSEQFLCVSPGFKNVFQFDLVHGEKEHVFHRPNSVVLSASTADRLFGDENPLGKTLGIKHIFLSPNKYEPLIVTGVIQDYPTNSHIQPDYLLTLDFFKKSLPPSQPDWQKNWGADYGWFTSYIRTNNGVDPSRLAQLFGK